MQTFFFIVFIFIPTAGLCFIAGYLCGIVGGDKDCKKWFVPQLQYFGEIIIEQELEIKAMKSNHTPIKGPDRLCENILTRDN